MRADQKTADAFASSWNNLPPGSVYTTEQVEDWFDPVRTEDTRGKRVMEMGCGNGSLLVHVAGWGPAYIRGIDLGASVISARANLEATGLHNWEVEQADLTSYSSDGFDFVYSIGVLHHLKDPKLGLDAVVRNVKPGGRFHCWVYAREGNALIIWIVDPIRKVASRLPWWFTKYVIATPLVAPYYTYAKMVERLRDVAWVKKLPLYEYSLWIAKREFAFFRHVAFDQLVTPHTVYIDRATIARWLKSYPNVEPGSTYIVMRNGNSWKFGGKVR
jgi:2-polyprenyl-3-methyl-5-hydroxy-6-metoxy-1,4-benzoquinol methylase